MPRRGGKMNQYFARAIRGAGLCTSQRNGGKRKPLRGGGKTSYSSFLEEEKTSGFCCLISADNLLGKSYVTWGTSAAGYLAINGMRERHPYDPAFGISLRMGSDKLGTYSGRNPGRSRWPRPFFLFGHPLHFLCSKVYDI